MIGLEDVLIGIATVVGTVIGGLLGARDAFNKSKWGRNDD